jgi:hypothetical protein
VRLISCLASRSLAIDNHITQQQRELHRNAKFNSAWNASWSCVECALHSKRTDGAPEPTNGNEVVEPLLIPSATDFKPGRPHSTSEYAAGPGIVSCRSVPLERVRSRMDSVFSIFDSHLKHVGHYTWKWDYQKWNRHIADNLPLIPGGFVFSIGKFSPKF